jgi:carbon-monoxide dehydrogenase medium subunit
MNREGKVIYSRRLPKFKYYSPSSIDEVCSLLSEHKGEAKVKAGGTDLLPMMKARTVVPHHIIGLKNTGYMDYITYDETRGLRVGAMVTHQAIADSPLVKEKFEVLATACRKVGTPQIRNLGTIGGNLCNAAPSADSAPALICLSAKVKLVSLDGERSIFIEDFFKGPGETALSPSELLIEIQVTDPLLHSGAVYLKHTFRSAIDLAAVGVAVMIILDSTNEVCKDVRIALGAVAPTPIRARRAEDFLRGKALKDNLIEQASQIAAEEARPITDVRSSAEYRKEMVRVLTRRAGKQAWEKAKTA